MNSPLQETLQLTEHTLFKNRVKIDSLLKSVIKKKNFFKSKYRLRKIQKQALQKNLING